MSASLATAGLVAAVTERAAAELRSTAEADAAARIAATMREALVPLAAAPEVATGNAAEASLRGLVALGYTLLNRTATGGPYEGALLATLDVFAAIVAAGRGDAALQAGAVRLAGDAYLLAHDAATHAQTGWVLRRAAELVAAVGDALAPASSAAANALNIKDSTRTASRAEFAAHRVIEGLQVRRHERTCQSGTSES